MTSAGFCFFKKRFYIISDLVFFPLSLTKLFLYFVELLLMILEIWYFFLEDLKTLYLHIERQFSKESVQNRDLWGFDNEIIFFIADSKLSGLCRLYPRIRALKRHLTPPKGFLPIFSFSHPDLHDFQFSFLQFLQMADIFQPPGSYNFFWLNWSQFLKSNFLLFKGCA